MSAIQSLVDYPMTVEAFLTYADARPHTERWELIDGVPVMTTNPSLDHEAMVGNLSFVIETRDDFGVIPDIGVRCGPFDGRRRTFADPILVVEVLSPSTMSYDRSDKLRHYLETPTLNHIARVYQSEMRVEHWARDVEGAWPDQPDILNAPEHREHRFVVPLFEVELTLKTIYEGTSLATA